MPDLSARMKEHAMRTDTEEKQGQDGGEEELNRALLDAAKQAEHVRFYNHPSADAKAEYWAYRPWTLKDAVALSMNKEPEVVNARTLAWLTPVWPFAQAYMERGRLFERIFSDQLGLHHSPNGMIETAGKAGVNFPAKLVALVNADVAARREAATSAESDPSLTALQSRIQQLESQVDQLNSQLEKEREQNPKSRKTTDALVFALAIKCRYKPDQRNGAATSIRDALLRDGVSLDDGVIRNRLSEAWTRFTIDDPPDE